MALTTVAGYKTREGISIASKDAEIGVVLAEAELLTARYCDRTLEDSGSSITEYANGNGDSVLYVEAYPISSVTSVSYLSSVTSGVAGYTAYGTGEYYSDASTGSLIRFGSIDISFDGSISPPVWPTGEKNIKIVYQGGYTSGTVPADLSDAIYDLMSIILHGRDGTREAATTEDVRAFLDERIPHYRRVTL